MKRTMISRQVRPSCAAGRNRGSKRTRPVGGRRSEIGARRKKRSGSSTSWKSTRFSWKCQNEELLQARAEVEAILGQYTDLYDFAPVGYFTLGATGRSAR